VADSSASESLPRPLLIIGIPLVGVLLVTFFLIRGFPYDVAGTRLSHELERAFGVRVDVAELGPALRFSGPGLEASDVRVNLPDSEVLTLDTIFARPAWSLSWLRGVPALYIEAQGPAGNVNGQATLGEFPGWEGVLDGINLSELPASTWVQGGSMEGVLSGEIDVRFEAEGPVGSAELAALNALISLPSLPVDIPFDELDAALVFGGDALLEITSLTGKGPIVSGKGSGKVARASTVQQSPLSLQFELEVKPALAGAVRGVGVRVDRQGRARVRVTGTVADPQIR
jgi:type II secretion system protein N